MEDLGFISSNEQQQHQDDYSDFQFESDSARLEQDQDAIISGLEPPAECDRLTYATDHRCNADFQTADNPINQFHFHVNKLYQPINQPNNHKDHQILAINTTGYSRQQTNNMDSLADEFSLSEDVKFLETTTRQLLNDIKSRKKRRKRRKQRRDSLSKILQDDDGLDGFDNDGEFDYDDDDDDDHDPDNTMGSDEADPLQLSAILDAFGSLPSSPMPLDQSSSFQQHHQQQQQSDTQSSSLPEETISTTATHANNLYDYHHQQQYESQPSEYNNAAEATTAGGLLLQDHASSISPEDSISRVSSTVGTNFAPYGNMRNCITSSNDFELGHDPKKRKLDLTEDNPLQQQQKKLYSGSLVSSTLSPSECDYASSHSVASSQREEASYLSTASSPQPPASIAAVAPTTIAAGYKDDPKTSSLQQQQQPPPTQPPASKYRRRTANARERIRMREINQAFEKLKQVVPIEMIQQQQKEEQAELNRLEAEERCRGGSKSGSLKESILQQASKQQQQQQQLDNEVKLTKITTLRLAVSYISKLSDILSQHEQDSRLSSASGAKSSTGATGIGHNNNSNSFGSDANPRARSRKRRSRASKPAAAELKAKKTPAVAPTTANKSVSQTGQLQVQQQQQQQHQIVITNSSVQGQQQQQASFAAYQPGAITISQGATQAGADRATNFVTPVVVAILGANGAPNGHQLDSRQQLQLVGIRRPASNATGGQQQQQAALFRPATGAVKQVGQQYNFVPQAQPVTLTLDDLSGLSVLRLANPMQGQQQVQTATIQLPVNHPILQQHHLRQQQQIGFSGYQQSNQANCNAVNLCDGQQYVTAATTSVSSSNNNASKQITGTNSDFNSAAPAAAPATVSSSSSSATVNFSSNQAIFRPTIAMNGQQLQQQQQARGPNVIYINQAQLQANQTVLVHQNQDQQLQHQLKQAPFWPAETTSGHFRVSQCDRQQANKPAPVGNQTSEVNINELVANLTTSIQPQVGDNNNSFLVQQPQQLANYDHLEAQKQQQQQQQQRQQQVQMQLQNQQPKKTYRFHNYDGNMINSQLYSNQHQQAIKRASATGGRQQAGASVAPTAPDATQSGPIQPPPVAPSAVSAGATSGANQRSRQNSLSSNCSSASLSSLGSSSALSCSTISQTSSPQLASSISLTPSIGNHHQHQHHQQDSRVH